MKSSFSWSDFTPLAEAMIVDHKTINPDLNQHRAGLSHPMYQGCAQILTVNLQLKIEDLGLNGEDLDELVDLLMDLAENFTPFWEEQPVSKEKSFVIPEDMKQRWIESTDLHDDTKRKILHFAEMFFSHIPWGWFSLMEYRLWFSKNYLSS